MDKSNVIAYAEGIAKEKRLSDKQKEELIVVLKEATSVLNGDQKRIEEALTFLDNKIQNSYEQFFTNSGINATEIKATTMVKVVEIKKEIEQKEIAERRSEIQAENHNEMLNSQPDKSMNVEVKETDLFNLPEAEVVAGIKGSLSTYFKDLDLPNDFLDKLSKDMYDAKKRDLDIEARVEAGEKREDVEAEVFPDEETRLKHGADVEIYDETAEEEYMQIVDAICEIAVEHGITLEEAETKFFEGKPESEYLKFKIEQGKDRDRIIELERKLEEAEIAKKSEGNESDKTQSYTLGRFSKRKFDRCLKYIEKQQQKLQFLEINLERVKKSGSMSDVAILEDEYRTCRSNIESYQKMIDRMIEKSEKREARRKDDIEFYKRNKGKVDEYIKQEDISVEAAASRVFRRDYKAYYRYLLVDKVLYNHEKRTQKEEQEKAVAQKFRVFGKKEIKSYVENQSHIDDINNRIAALEHSLETSRTNGNSKDVAMFEKQLADMRKEKAHYLKKIGKLEEKSNNITGENSVPEKKDDQTRGSSQLIIEEIQTGGEKKINSPFRAFKGLFKKGRTINDGVKSAYDGLATAQTVIKAQETEQTRQTPQSQDGQVPKQEDKSVQDEQVL